MILSFQLKRKFRRPLKWLKKARFAGPKLSGFALLLCCLLLLSFANLSFFKASETSQDCRFEKINRSIAKLDMKISGLDIQSKHLEILIASENGKTTNLKQYNETMASIDLDKKSRIEQIELIESRIAEVCAKIDSNAYEIYLLSVICAALFGFLSFAFAMPKEGLN